MTTKTSEQVNYDFWLGVVLALATVAVAVAMAMVREQPWWAELVATAAVVVGGFAGSAIIGGIADRAIRGIFITPTGVKWDYLMLILLVVVTFRYGLFVYTPKTFLLFTPDGWEALRSGLKWFMWVLGLVVTALGVRMMVQRRRTIAGRMRETADRGELDWHDDLKEYQVPLVLVAVGLTLFQMAA